MRCRSVGSQTERLEAGRILAAQLRLLRPLPPARQRGNTRSTTARTPTAGSAAPPPTPPTGPARTYRSGVCGTTPPPLTIINDPANPEGTRKLAGAGNAGSPNCFPTHTTAPTRGTYVQLRNRNKDQVPGEIVHMYETVNRGADTTGYGLITVLPPRSKRTKWTPFRVNGQAQRTVDHVWLRAHRDSLPPRATWTEIVARPGGKTGAVQTSPADRYKGRRGAHSEPGLVTTGSCR